jgi:AbiV family abortive infection protein
MVACVQNALALKADADLLAAAGRFDRAFTLYHCVCEELAKFFMLEIAGRKLRASIAINWVRFWKRFRNHESKMAQAATRVAASGASIEPATKELADASALASFILGIQPRNRSLYVELERDGTLSTPTDIAWQPRLELLSAQAELLFTSSAEVGHDAPTILVRFGEPSKANWEKALRRTVALQYLFTDMTPSEAHEQIDKLWTQANTATR